MQEKRIEQEAAHRHEFCCAVTINREKKPGKLENEGREYALSLEGRKRKGEK